MFSRTDGRLHFACITFVACVGLATVTAGEAPPAATESPSLPLTGGVLDDIQDSPAEWSEAQRVELAPLLRAIAALKASTDVQIATKESAQASYEELVKKPESYRGQVVTLSGTLQLVRKAQLPENDSGLKELWFCYLLPAQDAGVIARDGIVTYKGEIILVCLENPITSVALRRSVRGTGVFLKRLAYRNSILGGMVNWAPLVVCGSLRAGDAKQSLDQVAALAELHKTAPEIAPFPSIITVRLVPNGIGWKVLLRDQEFPIGCVFVVKREVFTKDLEAAAQKIMAATGMKADDDGSLPVPVKFIVPPDATMLAVERVMMKLVRVGLVNIQYSTSGPKTKPESDAKAEPLPAQPKLGSWLPDEGKKAVVHAAFANGTPAYEYQGEVLTRSQLREVFSKIATSAPKTSVRVSYEDDATWSCIMAVFDLAQEAGITECGLIPSRSNRSR